MIRSDFFEYQDFVKSGDDTFFLVIEKSDPKFDSEQASSLLKKLGAEEVHLIEA